MAARMMAARIKDNIRMASRRARDAAEDAERSAAQRGMWSMGAAQARRLVPARVSRSLSKTRRSLSRRSRRGDTPGQSPSLAPQTDSPPPDTGRAQDAGTVPEPDFVRTGSRESGWGHANQKMKAVNLRRQHTADIISEVKERSKSRQRMAQEDEEEASARALEEASHSRKKEKVSAGRVAAKDRQRNRRRLIGELELRRETLGEVHPDTLLSCHRLSKLLYDQGLLLEAEQHFRETLAGRRVVYLPGHPHLLITLNGLAVVLNERGHEDEAAELQREALRSSHERHGPSNKFTQQLGRQLERTTKIRQMRTSGALLEESSAPVNQGVAGRLSELTMPELQGPEPDARSKSILTDLGGVLGAFSGRRVSTISEGAERWAEGSTPGKVPSKKQRRMMELRNMRRAIVKGMVKRAEMMTKKEAEKKRVAKDLSEKAKHAAKEKAKARKAAGRRGSIAGRATTRPLSHSLRKIIPGLSNLHM